MKTNERTIESISLPNPLSHDDTIVLDGPAGSEVWTVKRSNYGWALKNEKGNVHPTIHDLDGMAEFIGAILDHAKGYN
jgi:hypothetical protein